MKLSKSVVCSLIAAIFFVAIIVINPFQLTTVANKVVAVAAVIIFLWVTEAWPIAVTSLLPIVLFPLLGIATTAEAASPYATPVIFLFMGGFMIGLAIEKWNLHKRIALNIIKFAGTAGSKIVFGFILATGFLSMWLSNTATTMMMYPIALSVINVVETQSSKPNRNLAICLLLSIAYASNLGGIATLVGTPPNVAYAAFIKKQFGYTLQFVDWMMIGLPIAVVLMASLYLVMTKWLFREDLQAVALAEDFVAEQIRLLGKISRSEKRVLVVFAGTAILWITNSYINTWLGTTFDDNLVAVLGAVLLFVIPSGDNEKPYMPLLQWEDSSKLAWGILLLFGGGISLAQQLENTGSIAMLGEWIAGMAGNNLFMLMLGITTLSIFLSEVMSNVAQVIVFAPVLSALAEAMNFHPFLLATPMVLAASCASMLPMGTPPNAIVFASGKLRLNEMAKTGLIINLIAILLITVFCYFLLPLIML